MIACSCDSEFRVRLADDKAVAILLSKKWHDIEPKLLTVGSTLLFSIRTHETLAGELAVLRIRCSRSSWLNRPRSHQH